MRTKAELQTAIEHTLVSIKSWEESDFFVAAAAAAAAREVLYNRLFCLQWVLGGANSDSDADVPAFVGEGA